MELGRRTCLHSWLLFQRGPERNVFRIRLLLFCSLLSLLQFLNVFAVPLHCWKHYYMSERFIPPLIFCLLLVPSTQVDSGSQLALPICLAVRLYRDSRLSVSTKLGWALRLLADGSWRSLKKRARSISVSTTFQCEINPAMSEKANKRFGYLLGSPCWLREEFDLYVNDKQNVDN